MSRRWVGRGFRGVEFDPIQHGEPSLRGHLVRLWIEDEMPSDIRPPGRMAHELGLERDVLLLLQ